MLFRSVGGHVQRVHARERGGETIADDGAIRGELDEHAVGVAVQRAVVDAVPCSVQLRQAVASGVRAVKQVDIVEVCLGVEGGEGDLREVLPEGLVQPGEEEVPQGAEDVQEEEGHRGG